MPNLDMYPAKNLDQKPKFKRDAIYLLVISLLLAACGQFFYSYHYAPNKERQVRVYYNQDVQVNVQVTRTIQDADRFVYFAIYTFTREDIRDALLASKYRGLEVRGLVDRKQTNTVDAQRKIIKELQDAGIEIIFNDHNYIMHLKTVVTDKGFVSGSYNWTASGSNLNDEIIEVGTDEDLRRQYEEILKDIFARYQH